MLGFRPVRLNASSRNRPRSEGGAGRPASAPPESPKSGDLSAAFPEVAWLFAVLSLQPRLDESGLRGCLRQLERRFDGQRVPDSYVSGVRQAAALLVAGARRSADVEPIPLLDLDQGLVPSNELLNVDAPWVLEGIDRSLPWLKLTSRSISGLTDAELARLGCARARTIVLERLPPCFSPESLPCCEARLVVTLIRSEAFLEGLCRLLVHCGLPEKLSSPELAFLIALEVRMVRELPLRLTYDGQDVTRPGRPSSLHHLEHNTVYLCNRDAALFSKFLPAIAFRLRQGLGLARGGPPVSIRQHILVAMLRQDDPAKIPALVDDMISSDSPERVRSPKRRARIGLESEYFSKTSPFPLQTQIEGDSLVRKLIATDFQEACDRPSPAERFAMSITWSVDPADNEGC